jgi:hypothetical protein
MTDLALQFLWVAAHHGLRRRTEMVLGSGVGDLGNQPRRAILERQWSLVHDVTSALGNPPAPRGPR